MMKKVKRILIADDNKDIHEDIKHILAPTQSCQKQDELKALTSDLFDEEEDTPLVENDPENIMCLEYLIEDAYHGEEAVSMVEAAEREGYPYSLIFMDVRMPPGMDGIQTVGKVWSINPHIEIVICTAYSDYSWDQVFKKFGHTDHLLSIKKPFDSFSIKQLVLSLTTKWDLDNLNRDHIENLELEVKRRTEDLNKLIVQLSEEITLRKEKEERLAYVANFDSLTGLLNRHSFYNALVDAIRENDLLKVKTGFYLFFIDIDGFKLINDTLGHDAGDLLLIEIAKRLHECLDAHSYKTNKFYFNDDSHYKACSTISRLGGDEFTAILTLQSKREIEQLSDQLIIEIRKPYTINNKQVSISCSLGISNYPEDADETKILVKYADIAMYRAKEVKNSFIFFDQIKDSVFMKQEMIENDLHQALEKNEFELYYQGLLDNGNSVIALEALVRWNHPTLGQLRPMEFIHIAEKSNYMIKIGEHVLRLACKHLKQIHQSGNENLCMFVNCTSKQLYDPNFINIVKSSLEENDLEPKFLKLGLEDKIFLHDTKESLLIINKLANMGIQFAVDMFIKGNSMFKVLQEFPVDTFIKIDTSYVENITVNKSEEDFLMLILDLIKKRNLNAIVSGIETSSQKESLKNNGCILQGYYFDSPKPFSQCLTDLHKEKVEVKV